MVTEIFGINISAERKAKILSELEQRCDQGKKTFIVTPYSEFFYHAFRDFHFKQILNSADYALADGISDLWLARYFSLPLKSKGYYTKIFEAFWQMLYTGSEIIFAPAKLHKIIPEKIPGSDFFWDLVRLADKKNLKVYLLGGYENTPELVAAKINAKFPNVIIAGYSNENPNRQIVSQINDSHPDILMVAYGPVRQEYWIYENLKNLNLKIAIGLGGTFDYIAEKKVSPPKWVRSSGLEWLYRLITQPSRIGRIWNATVGLSVGAIRQKVFSSMPFRPNVLGVIINEQGKVFIARRNTERDDSESEKNEEHWQFPQGGVDVGENMDIAVLREISEETAMQNIKVLGKSEQTNSYLWNPALKKLWFSRHKFKGQIQHIYYIKYLGDNSEIKLEHRELVEYKWVQPEELTKVIHPIRQDAVKIINSEIKKYL